MNASLMGQTRFSKVNLIVNKTWNDVFPACINNFIIGAYLNITSNLLYTTSTKQQVALENVIHID